MIVNVSIRTTKPELVEFFYPTFTKLSTYSYFVDNGVIFDGDNKDLQKFRDAGIPYIYIKGTPEYDLTIPENLLNFVYGKWNKQTPKYVLEYFKSKRHLQELEDVAKYIWITGKANLEEDIDDRLKNFYELLPHGSSYKLIEEISKVSAKVNTTKLFYRLIDYFEDLKHPNDVDKIFIRKSLERFKIRKENIEPAIYRFLYSPIDNELLKIMILLQDVSVIKYKEE